MKKCFVPFFGALLALHLQASPLSDKIKAFNDALKASAPKVMAGNPMLQRLLWNGDPADYPGGEANLESMVQQMVAMNSSPAVQKAGADLLSAIKDDELTRRQEISAKVDAVLARAGTALAQAQKPADLDAILVDLQSTLPGNGGYGMDPTTQEQNNRINTAYQFVAQWQDYLSERGGNNTQEALNSLRNLLNQRPDVVLMPRSKILDLVNTLEAQQKSAPPVYNGPARQSAPVDAILAGIKTLDDLEPAARQAMVVDGQSYDSTRLNQMANRYAQAKSGLPFSLDFTPSNFGFLPPQPGFARIDSILLLYLTPKYLGPSAPPPAANETVEDYLRRVMDSAESAQDLELLQKTVAAQRQISTVQPGNFSNSMQSLQSGLNQEIAGEYAAAKQSYEQALNNSDQNTPAKLIGERIAAIEKDHAADLAAAAQAPRPAVVPVYYPGYNPYYRPGMPGYPAPQSTPLPAPTSTSTPANSNKTASPSVAPASPPTTPPHAKTGDSKTTD